MIYTDKKFLSLVSSRLDKFKQKSEFLWNCRCPYCGDSKKSTSKARGYIYRKENNLFFRCHNCETGTTFGKFLKHLDPTLYKQFVMEKYEHDNKRTEDRSVRIDPPISAPRSARSLFGCDRISDLPKDHWAVRYILDRKIPTDFLSDISFCSDFKDTVRHMVPGKDVETFPNEEPRIIIPFFDANNLLIGFQGRSLLKVDKSIKYITIKLDEENPKVWGLNRIDLTKRIYVVEGPFDAMFLQNGIATTDSALYNVRRWVNAPNTVLVYDNEPRNREVVHNMEKSIDLKFDICVWPKQLEGFKDINDMIKDGNLSPSFVQGLIDKYTYSGIQAKFEISRWKKF